MQHEWGIRNSRYKYLFKGFLMQDTEKLLKWISVRIWADGLPVSHGQHWEVMSQKEQRPEAPQAISRMEERARSLQAWGSAAKCQTELEAERREQGIEGSGGGDQTQTRNKNERDGSGELCLLRKAVQCLSGAKVLSSDNIRTWHCGRILGRVDRCSTCKIIWVHKLSKLMSFGYAVIQTGLSCVKFRHSIPFILAQHKSLNYLS